tara:strand:+ start:67 stop:300 length:234 start_codon:yes stop_codon:yes gene_type:complete
MGNRLPNKEREFLKFQLRRKVTSLYKNFLFILEDLDSKAYNMDEESYQRYRKRILDHGNDLIREIEEDLDKFDIKLR